MKAFVCVWCTVLFLAAGAGELDLTGVFPSDVRTIGIVSMSFAIAKDKFDKGTNLLSKAGYRVKVMPNVMKVENPVVRARCFEQAWLDPEIDFLLFSTGGLGAADVIGLVDWERLKSRNMRVMGYSDVTLVLDAMATKGTGSPISGPMLSSFAGRVSQESCDRLRDVLCGNPLPLALSPVKPVATAVAGKPVGGLIERLVRSQDKGLLPTLDGRVLFIESTPKYADVSESLLDRLVSSGCLDNVAAVVFCDFNRKWEKARVDALFASFAAKVKCPVFSGYPYGHVSRSFAFDFTRSLSISPDGSLVWDRK